MARWDVVHLANISINGQIFNYRLSFPGTKHVI
ncbi:type VI secretion protein [Escherichia coli]|nr:type VI secretion protein [Escherichia coli]EFN6914889.1 type VI secretion protein [Escherichia coli O10]EFN7364355.1 type VI secretion protein [Escherichia coli O180:H14]EFC1525664.1 type VI secretion protein [Escherichia coli]EFC1623090.1 type VI secretion protein [Escherichia coli]